mgnify:CR=1 FL=1
MLTTLKNAFKIKDIRNRLLFTLVMLVVIRFGSQLPVPGVNRTLLTGLQLSQTEHLTFSMHLPVALS